MLENLCEHVSGCAGNLRITGNVNFPGRVSYVAGTCSLDGEGNNSSNDDDYDDDDDMASLPAICRPSAQLPLLLHSLNATCRNISTIVCMFIISH